MRTNVLFDKIKRHPYQYFFFKFFLFFTVVFLLDFIVGSFLNLLYFKQVSGMLYRTTYSIEKTTADLLIFGSSTATHNYHPLIFQKRLHMSYYNVGRDGTSIFYHDAVLKAVLKRYVPKIIIFNFDAHEFSNDEASYERLSSLLPYYKTHPEIRSIIDLKSPYEKYKLLSKIYPYNSSIFTIVAGNAEFNKKKNGDINGYVPLTNKWNEPIRDGNTFVNYELDGDKIKIYESFIKNCINLKIQLYIVCSPLFIKPDYVSNSIVLGKEIAAKYQVRFFDYSNDSTILNNPGLFVDIGHLNDYGAKVFSDQLIDSITANN